MSERSGTPLLLLVALSYYLDIEPRGSSITFLFHHLDLPSFMGLWGFKVGDIYLCYLRINLEITKVLKPL